MHLYGINMHLYKLSLSRESAGWGALALSDDPKSARLVTRRRQRISFLARGGSERPRSLVFLNHEICLANPAPEPHI